LDFIFFVEPPYEFADGFPMRRDFLVDDLDGH
jgi:hypothetical protein